MIELAIATGLPLSEVESASAAEIATVLDVLEERARR